MDDMTLHIDKHVKIEPSIMKLIPASNLTAAINGYVSQHERLLTEFLQESGPLALRMASGGTIFPAVYPFSVNDGKPTYFMLCSVTTKVQGRHSWWEHHACDPDEIDPNWRDELG